MAIREVNDMTTYDQNVPLRSQAASGDPPNRGSARVGHEIAATQEKHGTPFITVVRHVEAIDEESSDHCQCAIDPNHEPRGQRSKGSWLGRGLLARVAALILQETIPSQAMYLA